MMMMMIFDRHVSDVVASFQSRKLNSWLRIEEERVPERNAVTKYTTGYSWFTSRSSATSNTPSAADDVDMKYK